MNSFSSTSIPPKSHLQRRLDLYDLTEMTPEQIAEMKREFAMAQIREGIDTLREVYASTHAIQKDDVRVRSQLSFHAPEQRTFNAMNEVLLYHGFKIKYDDN
jgi:hypothetical protein